MNLWRRERWLLLLNAAALLASATWAWVVLRDVLFVEAAAPPSAASAATTAPHRAVTNMAAALDRPLFTAGRRPAPPPAQASPSPADSPPVLLGFAGSPERPGALLQAAGQPRPVLRHAHETLGSWQVIEVSMRRVRLRRDDQDLTLELSPRPAAPAAPRE